MKRNHFFLLLLVSIIVVAEYPATGKADTLSVNGLDIAKQMQDFYDSAWNKLISVIAGTTVLIGIILPWVTSLQIRIQKQEMETMISNAKKDIIDQSKIEMEKVIKKSKVEIIEDSKSEIMDTLTPMLDLKIEQGKDEINKLIAELEVKINTKMATDKLATTRRILVSYGNTYTLNSDQYMGDKDYLHALEFCFLALSCYVTSENEGLAEVTMSKIKIILQYNFEIKTDNKADHRITEMKESILKEISENEKLKNLLSKYKNILDELKKH